MKVSKQLEEFKPSAKPLLLVLLLRQSCVFLLLRPSHRDTTKTRQPNVFQQSVLVSFAGQTSVATDELPKPNCPPPCNVVPLSTTSVDVNNSSSHDDCNLNVRLVSKTRKDLSSPTQVGKKRRHVQGVFRSRLPTCCLIITLQVCRVILVQPIQCILLLVYEHSRDWRISSLSRFVIASCRGLLPVIAKVRPISVHSVTRCTLLASVSHLLLYSPVMVHSSCHVLNSPTVPRDFNQFCTHQPK